MSTRYSLPAASDSADKARSARTLAALALVIGIIGACLLVEFNPDAAAPLSAVPDVEAASEQLTPLGV